MRTLLISPEKNLAGALAALREFLRDRSFRRLQDYFLRFVLLPVALLAIVCLVLGLTTLYSRDITLDKVRSFDFRLIYESIRDRDVTDPHQREMIGNVLNALKYSNSYVLFPLALIYEDGCIENTTTPYLCAMFTGAEVIEKAAARKSGMGHGKGDLIQYRGNTFFYRRMGGDDRWLVGEAGKYLVHDEASFGRELQFAKEIPQILFTEYGRVTLARKNRWLWIFTLLVGTSIWFSAVAYKLGVERKFNGLKEKHAAIELKLRSKVSKISVMRANIERLEIHLLNEKASGDECIRKISVELEQAKNSIQQTETDYYELLERYESDNKKLSLIRKSLDKQSHIRDAEQAHESLNSIKKLWISDLSWIDRYNIERGITGGVDNGTPFTYYAAFCGIEWFIKTKCRLDRIDDNGTLEELIDRLKEKQRINKQFASLLHDARIARNHWFHDRKQPDSEIFENLIAKLDGQERPKVKAAI